MAKQLKTAKQKRNKPAKKLFYTLLDDKVYAVIALHYKHNESYYTLQEEAGSIAFAAYKGDCRTCIWDKAGNSWIIQ